METLPKLSKGEKILLPLFDMYKASLEFFKKMPEKFQLGYIMGLIEADGSFGIDLKNDKKTPSNPRDFTINPYLSVTQSENRNVILVIIADFFMRNEKFKKFKSKFPGRIETRSYETVDKIKVNRTEFRWQGLNMMNAIMSIFEQGKKHYDVFFIGQKYYDQLIIAKVLMLTSVWPKQAKTKENYAIILDLKFALHQTDSKTRKDTLEIAKNRKDRKAWETDLVLDEKSSENAAKTLLKEIDQTYFDFQNLSLTEKKINPYFITGLIEGDGYMKWSIATRSFTKPNIGLVLNGDENSDFSLTTLLNYFSSKAVVANSSGDKGKEVEIPKSELLNNSELFVEHFTKYPLITSSKQARFDLFITLVQKNFFKNQNFTRNETISIVKTIYAFEGKGRERTISENEMLKKVNYYYSQKN